MSGNRRYHKYLVGDRGIYENLDVVELSKRYKIPSSLVISRIQNVRSKRIVDPFKEAIQLHKQLSMKKQVAQKTAKHKVEDDNTTPDLVKELNKLWKPTKTMTSVAS